MSISNRHQKIQQAFQKGELLVKAVSPEGQVEWKRVEKVHRNLVPWEDIYEHRTEFGPMVSTGGHSVYVNPTETVHSEELRAGQNALTVVSSEISQSSILEVEQKSARPYMFDLTVEDHHNFVLHRSKIVVHNCPDKHYRFCPPEHESQIGQFNRIFGFVWEDKELLTYLRCALDWWNLFPPNTAGTVCSIDGMLSNPFTRSWRAGIKWIAIWHAMFALSVNWVHEEFSVAPDTMLRVQLEDGSEVSLTIQQLYEAIKNE